jgi:hypothetical protein
MSEYPKVVWGSFTRLSAPKKTALMCMLSLIVFYFRRPELLTNPQFWAEDLAVFYRDAYSQGFASLFHTWAGVLQLFPRLVALAVVQLPISVGPLLFNMASLLVMALPVFILWSDRTLLAKEGEFRKLVLTLLFVLMPNIGEIFGNLTNTIWFLAVASAMVLIRTDAKSAKRWLIFDCTILLASGLSGPFSGALALAAGFLLMHKNKRSRELYIKTGIIVACALVQIIVLASSQSPLSAAFNQRSALIHNTAMPVEITGMRFIALPMLGSHILTPEIATSAQMYALGIITVALMVVAFVKSRTEIRALILFAALLYTASFFRAIAGPILEFWKSLIFNSFGARYFFVPFFVWLIALLALTTRSKAFSAKIAAALLAAFAVFSPYSFKIPPLKDFNFSEQAYKFQTMKPGTTYCFKINPNVAWTTCLKKK